MNTRELKYSESFDLLLKWGEVHLFQQEERDSLKLLIQKWEFSEKTILSLYSDLEILEQKIRHALDFLHSAAVLDADSDETEKFQSEFKMLDQAVFLAEAVEFFPEANNFPEDFQNRSDDLLQQITIDREPSWLRLIPLNQLRREILKEIPPDACYLFPWYSEWAEFPEDIFDIIADHWENFIQGNTEFLNLDNSMLNLLSNALQYDQLLLKRIREDAYLFQLASQAVSAHLEADSFDTDKSHQHIVISLFSYLEKIREFLSPKLIGAVATACLAVFFTFYSFYESSRMVYKSPQKPEMIRKKIAVPKQETLPSEKQDTLSAPAPAPAAPNFKAEGEVPAPVLREIAKPEPESAAREIKPQTPVLREMEKLKSESMAGEMNQRMQKTAELGSDAALGGAVSESKHQDVASESETFYTINAIIGTEQIKEILNKEKYDSNKPVASFSRGLKEKASAEKILTPLERMPLDAFKLVAIVHFRNENIALLQDDSDKGYIVRKGAAVGIHQGRVTDILRDRIIVEEQTGNIQNELVSHKRELKMEGIPE